MSAGTEPARRGAAGDRRTQIVDAAVRVFARQGFHAARVSDIADEAGVAHGLLYHYFRSKEAVLDTIFSERWSAMLGAITVAGSGGSSARTQLREVAAFIFGSYRHDPDLMKVIVVEVTRAANTFGQTHLHAIRDANDRFAGIVAAGQRAGELRPEIDPALAAAVFYGAVEQILTGWIYDGREITGDEADAAADGLISMVCDGLAQPRT